ncbi:hypothetical protein A2W24_00205 [Microgenomates group bacterium RBG_16_45_19]|nr:MAG: hypothetical protein A2W24_00205 [Microgenomates group bacterium RBG_16_45_19]
MKIYYATQFVKHFERIPHRLQIETAQQEAIFKRNPEDLSLKTHYLKGKLTGLAAFSIDYHYRILIKFEPDGSVTFLDIGTHHLYR